MKKIILHILLGMMMLSGFMAWATTPAAPLGPFRGEQSYLQRGKTAELVNLGPSSWWVNMEYNTPLLFIYGPGIGSARPVVNYRGISIGDIYPATNPNYLIFDLNISAEASPGNVPISFPGYGRRNTSVTFELLPAGGAPARQPLKASDAIYQIVPDRFSNGNPGNDNPPGYLERSDRLNPSGIHGGDLSGIFNHLDYIRDLGFTAIELTPLYESNQFILSYEHMAPTSLFAIDARLGNLAELQMLVNNARREGLKTILTLLLNQAGSQHPLINDPPAEGWSFPVADEFTTDENEWLFADPHAAEVNRQKYRATFETMDAPLLNQDNEWIQKHIIQHFIWWIRQSGVDGIRIENAHLNQPAFLEKALATVKKTFPDLNIIASAKAPTPAHNFFWQTIASGQNPFTHATDAPLYNAVHDAFTAYQEVSRAIYPIYATATADFLYRNPNDELLVYADQHHLSRAFTLAEKDPAIFRMMMGFIFTFRGIPSMLYGTEVMLPGLAGEGSGFVRAPLPGGWAGDNTSVFNPRSLTADRQESLKFMKSLLSWRKKNADLMEGELTHYEPQNGLYIYTRTAGDKTLLVLINNHRSEQQRVIFSQIAPDLSQYNTGRDIVTGAYAPDLERIFIAPKTIMMLELQP